MPLYRPRMACVMTVPIMGTRAQRIQQERSDEVIQLTPRPTYIRLEANDHNQADALEIGFDWREAGTDPRLLRDAVVEAHITDAEKHPELFDADGAWFTTSRQTCCFIGLVKEPVARRGSEQTGEITLHCVDYTTLFLKDSEPFGSDGIPSYNQTLSEAWNTIVSQTPGAEVLADRLVFQDVDPSRKLSEAVAERFKKLDRVPTKPKTDAWTVWQQCVGMLGLISYIRKDECIVTTATNYYTEADSPVFVYGKNIEEWSESAISADERRGVCITSYDPLGGRALEAFYPPLEDKRTKPKRVSAAKVQKAPHVRRDDKRDYFACPYITEQKALDAFALRVWEERSRQELSGCVKTVEMRVDTESAAEFDLLNLGAGDSVRVEVEPENREILASLPTEAERISFLTSRGYSRDVAMLCVANMKDFGRLESKFLTKRVATELEIDENGGRFAVDIEYINRIQVDGSAVE